MACKTREGVKGKHTTIRRNFLLAVREPGKERSMLRPGRGTACRARLARRAFQVRPSRIAFRVCLCSGRASARRFSGPLRSAGAQHAAPLQSQRKAKRARHAVPLQGRRNDKTAQHIHDSKQKGREISRPSGGKRKTDCGMKVSRKKTPVSRTSPNGPVSAGPPRSVLWLARAWRRRSRRCRRCPDGSTECLPRIRG